MFQRKGGRVVAYHGFLLLAIWPVIGDSLIITSVIAGDKKFKTISFDHKWIKPLTFEKELANTEFRRHRTLRPPKFDIDINIPIKLPLEDEYPQEYKKKPVETDVLFQTHEINEPSYGKNKYKQQYPEPQKKVSHKDRTHAVKPVVVAPSMRPTKFQAKPYSTAPQQQQVVQPQQGSSIEHMPRNSRSDEKELSKGVITAEESNLNYQAKYHGYQEQEYSPEFIPGGFLNLKLSGPTGGPAMTYEDYDREKWAQKLSQTAGAMPYPILNYHQLQNFYGGLGTFTNGLAESRYVESSLLDKFKSHVHHLASKLHMG